MVSFRKKKNQQKRQLSQLDEILKNVSHSENLEKQTNGQSNDFERVENSARQNQVIENNFDNQIRTVISGAVMTVENCMHNKILTAIDNMVIPRVKMALKSITGSTGHGTNSEVQNPDRRDFLGNIRSTPLVSASSQLDLNNQLNRNYETRNDVDFEDCDFPALKPNYNWREYAHHNNVLISAHAVIKFLLLINCHLGGINCQFTQESDFVLQIL